MHEVSIMTEAVRLAVAAAQAAGARQITSLRLRVGTLSGAAPEALTFAWDIVRRDTLAECARLEIETIPATGWCATCRAEFAAADFLGECPRCHEPGGPLQHGRELEIAAVDFI
jgi:hydrogenase nickel incorporation protein HypA/HybF